MSSTAVSTHLLCIDNDFSSVFSSVQSLSADWRKICVGLGITFDRLGAIESNRKNVDEMLMDMIAAWLRRDSETQPEPTWRKLCEAVGKINRRRAEVIAQEHQCGCFYCLAGTRNTSVAREVESHNVDRASRALKEEFDEMMEFISKEVKLVDAEKLRYKINSFLKHERKVNETLETHLSRIEDFKAPSAILMYLYRHEFIGYINYALLKKVQEVMKSRLLDKHMKEYEKDYHLFLQCALNDTHAAFKKCPELQPNYPVGLPSFTIHLESDWDGQSMYEWKELFERRFSWPETLNVVKISENYTVLPKFAEDVVKDLGNPTVIADLNKNEGMTSDISPQLLAYHHHGDFPTATGKEVFAGAKDQQGTVEQSVKAIIKMRVLNSRIESYQAQLHEKDREVSEMIESYQAQLHEKDREISVQRKIILTLTEEKECIIRERRYERKRGKDDTITEFKKPKNSVDEMDEPVLPEMPEQMKVDVGVQFNYVKRETDHLQGVKVFNSKLFTVHGDQPQPLIWDGHGFELHLSEGSCHPDEDCEIMVDAVVGGDFVFPKGVEPVSAIYIISITSKLHKPSVLKIQHCVALDKASKHCHLSFYRALLKEPQPPYHFKCLKGGKFDIENQFGELELPAFCSVAIGKGSSSSYESGSDTLSVFECNSASLSSGVSDPSEEWGSSQVDSSIIYHGQAFYLQEQLNRWQFKFIVVKNLDAFREYVMSNLQDHETDLQVSLTFSESHIELVLNGEEVTNKFKGWSIRPRSVPLTLPLKRAASFGYEKEASIPPTCLMTVSGDKRVKRYSETLYYPVALKGALTGSDNQEPKVYIERTMKKKGTTNVKQPPRDRVNANKPTPATDIKKVKKCITDVINERYASLRGLIESSIEDFAAQMLSNKLITPQIQRNPSFDSIMMCFLAGFEIQDELEEVQDYCHQFFSALYDIGGQFERIADKLKKVINEKLQETMKIKLDM